MPAAAVVPPTGTAPYPWLVADIGGTNARFGWVGGPGATISHQASLRVDEHAGPLAAVRAYLALAAKELGSQYRNPGAGAWALATAITGERVVLTNAGWTFSRPELQQALGLQTLLLLNDFEALALSLPRLRPEQLHEIGKAATGGAPPGPWEGEQIAGSAKAVIGPGTGLGVATLVPCHAGLSVREAGAMADAVEPHWLAIPGEGGHASLAAADDFESALLAVVRRRFQHVSAERLLSGIGLPVLHQGVASVRGVAAPEMDTHTIISAGIALQGASGADALCKETLEHFCALLGGFAGNVALTVGARGGLYIGGGIVPRLGALFFHSRFRERFEAKGRFAPYLRAIPTWLIADTRAALTGAALALQQRRG